MNIQFLARDLVRLETDLAGWERYLAQQVRTADEAGRQSGKNLAWFLVGLFLIPVLIGLIVAPLNLFSMWGNNSARAKALSNQARAQREIEKIRSAISQCRAQLSVEQLSILSMRLAA